MSYLGYDVNKDVTTPNFQGALDSGLKTGQQFSAGLLQNYQMKQQMAVAGQLQQLKQAYMNAPDDATRQGLLSNIMVLDPAGGKNIAESQQIVGGGMQGTDFNAQLYNQRLKLYTDNGVTLPEAKQRAANDILSTIVSQPNMLGQTVTRPGMSPIGSLSMPPNASAPNTVPGGAPAGNLAPFGNTAPAPAESIRTASMPASQADPGMQPQLDRVSNKLPIAENISQATPQEKYFVDDVMTSKDPATTYNAGVKDHPELAAAHPKWDDQIAEHFQEIHNALNENVPLGGKVVPNIIDNTPPAVPGTAANNNNLLNTPLGQTKLTEARANKSVDDETQIQTDAANAAKNLDGYKNVYSIFNSGFKGGATAPYSYAALQTKQAAGIPLTPEEQQYANDYTTLKKMSDIGTGSNIKDMFQRVTNFELGFAKNLQAQPNDMPTSAVITAAIREAADRQKMLKNDLKDQWVNQYGSLASKSPSGQDFSSALTQQLDNHPLLTPSFMAERGVTVPIRPFGKMTSEDVMKSLPIGATFINPKDGQKYTKTTNTPGQPQQ